MALTDCSNGFSILMSHFGSCTFVFEIKFIINLVSVIGHYFMSHVLNICILPFMPCSRRRNDVFTFKQRQSAFMSCAMIPLRSEAKSFSISQIAFNSYCLCWRLDKQYC